MTKFRFMQRKYRECWASELHCVKSVQIQSFFWSEFSCIRTEYGPEITPYLDTFYAELIITIFDIIIAFFLVGTN